MKNALTKNGTPANGKTSETAVTKMQDARAVARELSNAYRSNVDYYTRKVGRSTEDAIAAADEPMPPEYMEYVLTSPPEEMDWHGMEDLERQHPGFAHRRWEHLKKIARDELEAGHHAAKATEGHDPTVWQRATFLAVRDDLVQAWQPVNGAEHQLIDQMAQAQTAMNFWQQKLSFYASVESMHEKNDIEKHDKWNPPRVSDHQAMEQAAAMVDRFSKMYHRNLRAFRELRRQWPKVVVQNAGQVNVAEQQVNMVGE